MSDPKDTRTLGATGKKEFNKRKWREKKYSKKTALDSWKKQKEKKLQRNYFKMMKKESKKFSANIDQVVDGENPNLEPLGNKEGGKMAELAEKELQDKQKEQETLRNTENR